jgi:Tol biopolymer transport system component
VNTPGDEANPNLSNNNLWLVYSSTAQGRTEIHLFDMVTQLVDNLPVLNASSDSNVSPSVNNDGDLIAYTSRELGIDRLHIYNVRTDTNYVPAPVARLGTTINNPFISGDGTLVAFSSPVLDHQLDIFIYSVVHGTVLAAPFVNTESSEDEPAFSPDNQRMAFSTNRNGNEDVMLVDFRTGFVDRLPLANSHADEVTPSFIGTAGDQLLYLSDRGGKSNRQMLVYEFKNDLVDTIPVSHVIGKLDTFSPP